MKWLLVICLCAAGLTHADPRYAGGDYVGDVITLGARDLSPRLSRFLETDPAHQFASGYSYAGGSPITAADPTGAVVGSELIAVRMIEDTRGLYPKSAMTAENTREVSYAHIASLKRYSSMADFLIATDAAVLFKEAKLHNAPWHVASCNYCSPRRRGLSLRPYQEEWGAERFKRKSRDRRMAGFDGDTPISSQLDDAGERALVGERDLLLAQYKRRMEFLADPAIMKVNGVSSPLVDFRQEPDNLYKSLRDNADKMAVRITEYDELIAKRRAQAGDYSRGLELARVRHDNMGFLYFAQQDPQVLRALHESHRSLIPRAAPKSRWSWLPWKRK